MNLPAFYLMSIAYLAFSVFMIITLLITIGKGVKQANNVFSNAMILFSEIIFTIIGPMIGFLRFDQYQPDIPFSKPHVFSIIILVFISSRSFWIARFTKNHGSPVTRILVSVGLLQGILLCLIVSIHFIPYFALGLLYPTLGFELLSPIFAFLILLREFYFYNKTELTLEQLLPNRKELGFVPLPFIVFHKPLFTKCIICAGLLIPLLAVEVGVAYAFGQDIDAVVKAFTHSRGFIFSSSYQMN